MLNKTLFDKAIYLSNQWKTEVELEILSILLHAINDAEVAEV